jgi:hypothetical protein
LALEGLIYFVFLLENSRQTMPLSIILIQMVLFGFVIDGKNIAKWITTILFVVGDYFAVVFFLENIKWSNNALLFFIPIAIFSYCIYLMFIDKDCIKYFKSKQEKENKKDSE